MHNISSSAFIKVIILQIDPLYETQVVDEHHFSTLDRDKIETFKEPYSSELYHIVELEMR
jgi:hypothetical protein